MSEFFWLRKRRMDKNLTQAEVAEMVGITREYYNRCENGRHDPQEYTKLRISEVLGFNYELWFQEEKTK